MFILAETEWYKGTDGKCVDVLSKEYRVLCDYKTANHCPPGTYCWLRFGECGPDDDYA